MSNAHRALPRSRHLAPASCVDKIVSFSAEPEPLNFCSIAEPHTTSRLRIDPIPRPPSIIQTPSLGLRNTRLDVFSSSTHRHARISNRFFSLRDHSRACDSPTARRASLSSVAPVSRVRDSGSTFSSLPIQSWPRRWPQTPSCRKLMASTGHCQLLSQRHLKL